MPEMPKPEKRKKIKKGLYCLQFHGTFFRGGGNVVSFRPPTLADQERRRRRQSPRGSAVEGRKERGCLSLEVHIMGL